MNRREFLSAAAATLATSRLGFAEPQTNLKPMALGLLIKPADGPEATISRVKNMGFSNCFFSLDAYIGKYTPALADEVGSLLK
ncbi:MAG TPA: hypothetical protein VKH40_07520, partial [Alloacidobacterium sp.]|nr:hypothetical protein [Alloacidobacterium sp.]